ncbi:MAG: hypothetical protein KIT10_02380 [Flavobacteriales bacterium]|nr:hypothetical protein [Flavobacteriales bacterium]
MDILTIRAFRATDDPASCAEFLREHVRVLTDYGITHVNTNNADWITDPDVHVITVEHAELGMVGGARVHVRTSADNHLPIELAIGKLDPSIHELVRERAKDGVGELCGMWNAVRYHGKGMPTLFGLSAISLASQLGIKTLLGLAARYTLDHSLDFGFRPVLSIGDQGVFHAYPRRGFQGIVVGIDDLLTLEHAIAPLRERILSLRMAPDQKRVERTTRTDLFIHYRMRLDNGIHDLATYDSIREDRLRYIA